MLPALWIALTIGQSAPAKDAEAGVIYQKKTVVSFDADLVDGHLNAPDVGVVNAHGRVRHSDLLQIRESFRAAILQSVRRL